MVMVAVCGGAVGDRSGSVHAGACLLLLLLCSCRMSTFILKDFKITETTSAVSNGFGVVCAYKYKTGMMCTHYSVQ